MVDLYFTSLHKGAIPAAVKARARNYSGGEITLPRKDMKQARLTLSSHSETFKELEETHGGLEEYRTMLYVLEDKKPRFWGPVVYLKDDDEAATCEITAIDLVRLNHHFLRIGDDALNNGAYDRYPGDKTKGSVFLDYRGLRMLLDAAQNTDAQDARGVPPLGIGYGTNTDTVNWNMLDVSRGDNVLDKMKEVWEDQAGPDVEFTTESIEDAVESFLYSKMNTYPPGGQGTDRRDEVILQSQFGNRSVKKSVFTSGGQIATHAVVTGKDKLRVISADIDLSAAIGVYVAWISKNSVLSETTLSDFGKAYLAAYAPMAPDIEVELWLPNERSVVVPGHADKKYYKFEEDYFMGDIITVQSKRGYRYREGLARVDQYKLTQENQEGGWRPSVGLMSHSDVVAEDEEV